MVEYAPNKLTYRYSAAEERFAVFSEIWYPGWTAQLEDGTPIDLLRADYTLRGALLPAGEHSLVMRFAPESYRIGSMISRVASISLILTLLLSLALFIFKGKNQ